MNWPTRKGSTYLTQILFSFEGAIQAHPEIRRVDPRRDAFGHEFHQLRRVNAIFAPQAIQAHLKFWRIDPRRDASAHECHQLRPIHVPFGPHYHNIILSYYHIIILSYYYIIMF